MASLVPTIRWLARVLSLLAAGFFLTFAVGEGLTLSAFGGRQTAMLILLLVGLTANIAAWRWEAAGAGIALGALLGLAAVQVLAGQAPGRWFLVILGAPALCFLLARVLSQLTGRSEAAT